MKKFKSPFSLNIDYSKRAYGLDVFRAVAIITVVIQHGNYLIEKALPGFPWFSMVDGVELFFVLSGFLIGSILIKTVERHDGLKPRLILEFWKRRWLRTLPAYYFVLLLNIIVVKYGIIRGDISQFNYSFFIFTQNFLNPFVGFFWESWSLTIEEWFYLTLPVLLLIGSLAATSLSMTLPTRRTILAVIIVMIIAPLLIRISRVDLDMCVFSTEERFRKIVLLRLDAIAFGVLAAYVKLFFKSFWEKRSALWFVGGIVLIYVVKYVPHDRDGFYSKTFLFSMESLGCMMLLPLADRRKSFRTRFGRAITHISLVSYSMYLINLCLVAQVMEVWFMPSSAAGGVIEYVIYWAVVIGASTLMYRFIEKPFLDMREKLPAREKVAAQEVAYKVE